MVTPTKQMDSMKKAIFDLSKEKTEYLHKTATARQKIAKYDELLKNLTPTKKMSSTTKSDLAVRRSQYKAQRAAAQAQETKYEKKFQDVKGRIDKLRAEYDAQKVDLTSVGPGFTPRPPPQVETEVSPTGTLGKIGKVLFADTQPSVDAEDDLFAYLASDAYKDEHKQNLFGGYQLFAVGGFERGVTVYKNPVTDTMIFAIRGTRMDTFGNAIRDMKTWIPIVHSDEALRITEHFTQNKAFVDRMISQQNPTDIIYTGHSLGGSESIAMLEDNRKGRAVVFNPGIGVGWTKEEFEGVTLSCTQRSSMSLQCWRA